MVDRRTIYAVVALLWAAVIAVSVDPIAVLLAHPVIDAVVRVGLAIGIMAFMLGVWIRTFVLYSGLRPALVLLFGLLGTVLVARAIRPYCEVGCAVWTPAERGVILLPLLGAVALAALVEKRWV